MSETTERQRKPRFNHVAMSIPAELLSPAGRAELLRFYEDVFGWTEVPTLTEDDKRLVLQAYRNDQFVFLVSDSNPMTCPRTRRRCCRCLPPKDQVPAGTPQPADRQKHVQDVTRSLGSYRV